MEQDHAAYVSTRKRPFNDDETTTSSFARAFGESQDDKQRALLEDLEQIEKQIAELEKVELSMKMELGMTVDADSADVRQMLSGMTLNPSSARKLDELNDLYRYRIERSRILDRLDYPTELNMVPLLTDLPPFVLLEPSHVHAVIMGIDMYGSYPLRGCVSDALLVEEYLKEHLGVPNNHIQLLLGSEDDNIPDNAIKPSRANIIRALIGLATNDEIKFGDNIIVYFAGHGSSYLGSDDANTYGIIETLCPIDHDRLDDNGKPIPDISDREFNTILSRIAEVKGHRITVILDCCHAGGQSRNLPQSGSRTTNMAESTLEATLLAGENHLKDYPNYCSILKKDWRPNMKSHVLLAACKDYQLAKEKQVKGKDGVVVGYIGVFTDSLVRVLRSRSGYCNEDTYIDLIDAIGSSSHQTPVAVGANKNARVWYLVK